MAFTPLLMGLAALAGTARASAVEGEGAFVELFKTDKVGDPAEEVLYVFADRGPEGDELQVLSHEKTLGVIGLAEGQPVPVADPRIRLPAELGPGQTWVFSENSIGTATFEGGSTIYHRFFPEGPDVTRAGSWGVLASFDGSALFFVRGGTEVDHPAEFAVVDENGERLQKSTRMLPRIQSSRNGDQFVVQAEKNEFHQIGAAPIGLPPGGTLYLQPAAHWVVHELQDRIELHRVTDDLVVAAPPSISPPLMAVEFEGIHVLLVARTRAELLSLGSTMPGKPVESLYGIDATEGHRFSSAALFRRGGEGLPWVALGELAVRVPQMELPNAPAPSASAVVRAVDRAGTVVERWSFDITDWRASTPLVQWSKEGRLVASTMGRVLVSPLPLP